MAKCAMQERVVEKAFVSEQSQNTGEVQPRIVRGRVGSLSLYEITDYELDVLATGSPNSVYFNFAVFFLSVGLSFLTTLLSATFSSERRFTVFLVIAALGIAIGLVLLVVWARTRSRVDDVITRIKERVPPPSPMGAASEAESSED